MIDPRRPPTLTQRVVSDVCVRWSEPDNEGITKAIVRALSDPRDVSVGPLGFGAAGGHASVSTRGVICQFKPR